MKTWKVTFVIDLEAKDAEIAYLEAITAIEGFPRGQS